MQMQMCKGTIKRDALTAIAFEVPDFEVPVLQILHGDDMVHVSSQEPFTGIDARGEFAAPDVKQLWDTLMMKYGAAAKEDRKEMTGHPVTQVYFNFQRFSSIVGPTLPKAPAWARRSVLAVDAEAPADSLSIAPKKKPAAKRSHHKKPLPPPAQLEA